MNTNLMIQIPAVEQDELFFLQSITANLQEDKLQLFIAVYNSQRKKKDTILLCCLLGFVGASGIQRFVVGQIGMGVLYFFTGGLCLIGTIVDIVNHKQLAFGYNQKMAAESMRMVNG